MCASLYGLGTGATNATEVISANDNNNGSEEVRIYRPTVSAAATEAAAPPVAETRVVVNVPIYFSGGYRRNWGWRGYRRGLRATGPNYPGFGGRHLGPRYPF